MDGPTAEFDALAEATCLVCGASVVRLIAPLHAEDHMQRGEYPTSVTPPASTATDSRPDEADNS